MDLLTPHFSRWEFVVSREAVGRGIDNTPTADAWDSLQSLALTVLEPTRAALGALHVSSGYRCPDLNAAVNGARGSQHMRGEAADLIPHSCTLGTLYRYIVKYAPFDQVIWEFGQWVHVSHKRAGPQRGERLLAWMHDGKTRYAPVDDEQMAAL